MKRRDIPRLAAAFVVTFSSAACSEASPKGPEEPHWNPPPRQLVKHPDGTCGYEIDGNPPGFEPAPCPEEAPTAAPTSTFATPPGTTGPVATAAPTTTAKPDLEDAPAGWRVEPNADGTCTAYGPDPCNHPGCNPPRPRKVACPPSMQPAPSAVKPKKGS